VKTVVVGLILAFLLFTPQGQFIAMSAIGPAIMAIFDAHHGASDPDHVAREAAAQAATKARENAWDAKQELGKKGAENLKKCLELYQGDTVKCEYADLPTRDGRFYMP
jgi:hypothetical protein